MTMMSYRFRRRAFLGAMGGGVGLKIMLRTLEGSAQGMKSPARLLLSLWPGGIVPGVSDSLWKPTSGSVGGSPALKPFADAGLGPDMTVIRGLSTAHLTKPGLSGHGAAAVALLTAQAPGGARTNCCGSDDAFAVPGGSLDQLLLKNVTALQRPGVGYANSICDARTDFSEIAAQCMSYSTSSDVVSLYGGSGVAPQALPLKPVLSPLQQYNNLFAAFVPSSGGTGNGGAGGASSARTADAALKNLVGRRSVLDFAIEELNQAKRLAPSAARNKLAVHTDAVVAAETAVVASINTMYPKGGRVDLGPACGCTTKPAAPIDVPPVAGPPPELGTDPTPDRAEKDDTAALASVGKAHLDVLKAAFICDIMRVGTFMWSSTTNRAGFAMYPGSAQAFRHIPFSRHVSAAATTTASTVEGLFDDAHFLYNVQTWYFARHAEHMAAWKNTVDGCGNGLLDNTCAPFLTDVAGAGEARDNLPAMLIGGKKLGFQHDRYATGQITINQFWGTIAQALGYPTTAPPFAAPVAGYWTKPA